MEHVNQPVMNAVPKIRLKMTKKKGSVVEDADLFMKKDMDMTKKNI